ncbi:MAG: dTDP-4-dehydrorhamnose 3,5-epimerase [Candidatus Marinimicrobia bacterium]|nr:dTDP-4-dehydrorhamnose 3,5-epimerase [Candidatus Neomarinimicrobiota bacterium]
MSESGIQILPTPISGLLVLRPVLHEDTRGMFLESYRDSRYAELGINDRFVQDNLVHSVKNVFRGLHFQRPPYAQAKLISMIAGEILDVVLDLRRDSQSYLKTALLPLHAEKHEQLYIPAGFAHGYYVLSDKATISYKVSQPYAPDHQSGIHWDSPELKLREHIHDPLLSEQDRRLPELRQILSEYKFLF